MRRLLLCVALLACAHVNPAAPGPALELVESQPVETSLDRAALRDAWEVWPQMIEAATARIDLAEFYASYSQLFLFVAINALLALSIYAIAPEDMGTIIVLLPAQAMLSGYMLLHRFKRRGRTTVVRAILSPTLEGRRLAQGRVSETSTDDG